MTVLTTAKSVVTHRGVSCLELHRKLGELTRQVARLTPRAERVPALEARLDEQALTIGSLREQLTKAKTIRADINAKYGRYTEAEARATAAEKALTETVARIDERNGETVRGLEEQLAALQQRLDIACKAETAVTKTQEFPVITPVMPLSQARDAGLLGPVTDPGHATTH